MEAKCCAALGKLPMEGNVGRQHMQLGCSYKHMSPTSLNSCLLEQRPCSLAGHGWDVTLFAAQALQQGITLQLRCLLQASARP